MPAATRAVVAAEAAMVAAEAIVPAAVAMAVMTVERAVVVALPEVGVPLPAEEIAPPVPHAFIQQAANCAVHIGGGAPPGGSPGTGLRAGMGAFRPKIIA